MICHLRSSSYLVTLLLCILLISCGEDENPTLVPCIDCSESQFVDSLEEQNFWVRRTQIGTTLLIPQHGEFQSYTVCNDSLLQDVPSEKLIKASAFLYHRCEPSTLQFPVLTRIDNYELIQNCTQIKDSINESFDLYRQWEIIEIESEQTQILRPCEVQNAQFQFQNTTASLISVSGFTGSNTLLNEASITEEIINISRGCTSSDSDPISADAAIFENHIFELFCPQNSESVQTTYSISKNFITLTNVSKNLTIQAQAID